MQTRYSVNPEGIAAIARWLAANHAQISPTTTPAQMRQFALNWADDIEFNCTPGEDEPMLEITARSAFSGAPERLTLTPGQYEIVPLTDEFLNKYA